MFRMGGSTENVGIMDGMRLDMKTQAKGAQKEYFSNTRTKSILN